MPSAPSRLLRSLGAAVGTLAIALSLTVGSVPEARADVTVTPYASTVTVTGSGFGHGWGMSQYGAYGAATMGKTWQQILGFYYTGTTLGALGSGNQIRVWITADTDATLTVYPADGLRLRDLATNMTWTLPTGSGYTQWRISRSGSSLVLHYRDSSGAWVAKTPSLASTATWQVENSTTKIVKVAMPGSRTRELRGQVSLTRYGSGARTVNRLAMEDYLRSVVPSEMPTSWAANAVRAQAVAARSYAARLRAAASSSAGYDLCDTTACQVYRGAAETVSGRWTSFETTAGNAAITSTANQVVMSGSTVALTQFSSSNGGHTARGDYAYLVAQPDPYDGVTRNQAWSVALSSATIQRAYPSVGTLRSVQVTSRDGAGRWGGRVNQISIVGSNTTISVSGTAFRTAFGLRSNLFNLTAGLAVGSATYQRWQADGGVTGWLGAPTASERTVGGGSEARFEVGDVLSSSVTGTKAVQGGIRSAYRRVGGAGSFLGFPTTDETAGPVNGSYQSRFAHGAIYWSSATGGHELHGAISTYYRTASGSVSRLGLPTTDQQNGTITGSRKNSFQRGGIYWSSATGAREVSGSAYTTYRSLGQEASRLGLPTTSIAASGTGTVVTFQHGRISCPTTGACTVVYR